MQVDIDTGELDEMARDFKAMAARAADLTPVTKPAAERLRSVITMSFTRSRSGFFTLCFTATLRIA